MNIFSLYIIIIYVIYILSFSAESISWAYYVSNTITLLYTLNNLMSKTVNWSKKFENRYVVLIWIGHVYVPSVTRVYTFATHKLVVKRITSTQSC